MNRKLIQHKQTAPASVAEDVRYHDSSCDIELPESCHPELYSAKDLARSFKPDPSLNTAQDDIAAKVFNRANLSWISHTRGGFFALLLLTLSCLWAGCATQHYTSTSLQVEPPPPPFPIPVIDLRGTPTDIGHQHGEKLNTDIHFLVETYLRPFFKTDTQRFIALTAASGFRDKLLPRHQQELDALAESTKLDSREALLAQCFLDLSKLMACSTIALPADASPDHIARLGRNLDFPSLDVADKHTVVFIVHPESKHAYCAIGWPGMMGVLSGMNDHGLTLCNMEVARHPRLPSAMPYTLLYRTVLEDCATVDEAIAFLEKTPRQTANNLMLMDAAGDRAAVEITPEAIHVRRGLPGKALLSTNHQRGDDQDTPGKCWRYDLLHQMSTQDFGHIDTAALEQMLQKVQQGKMTLQSMVFEPKTQTLYLATGIQAADQQFFQLNLKKRW